MQIGFLLIFKVKLLLEVLLLLLQSYFLFDYQNNQNKISIKLVSMTAPRLSRYTKQQQLSLDSECRGELGNGVHLIRAKERVPSSSLPEETAVPRPSTTRSLITVN